jgi:hypothetical protein
MERARLIHKELVHMGYVMRHADLLMRSRGRRHTFYTEYVIEKNDIVYRLHVKAFGVPRYYLYKGSDCQDNATSSRL